MQPYKRMNYVEKGHQKTTCQVTPELDLGHQRFLTPSPVLKSRFRLLFLLPEAVLRTEPCNNDVGVENTCMVHTTEPR